MQHARDLFDGHAQVEVQCLDRHAAGFEPRIVERVVDESEQRLRALPDQLHELARFGRQLALEEQIRDSNDAVHRRADLVAHRGEEVALDARELARLGETLLQFAHAGLPAQRGGREFSRTRRGDSRRAVTRDADEELFALGAARESQARLRLDDAAVRARDVQHAVDRAPVVALQSQQRAHDAGDLRGHQQVRARRADAILHALAGERLECGRGPHQSSPCVRAEHEIRGRFQHFTQTDRGREGGRSGAHGT